MEHDGDMDYHHTLEPDVIIDDESETTLFDPHRSQSPKELLHRIVPDVSLIPVSKNGMKLRAYNHSLPFYACAKTQRIMQRAPRQTVRLISKEELLLERNDTKRNSLPLQKCPVCKKFFRRMKTHLQKHENVVRDPNDKLVCKYCRKGFNTGSNLSIHMRTHTGDKPYVCAVCRKGFAQSCNLVNHMRIHTGERPYRCPHCERAFTQSGNLSNHIRLHTDEKPFQCHFCEKAFTQSGNLNSHIRNNHKIINELIQ